MKVNNRDQESGREGGHLLPVPRPKTIDLSIFQIRTYRTLGEKIKFKVKICSRELDPPTEKYSKGKLEGLSPVRSRRKSRRFGGEIKGPMTNPWSIVICLYYSQCFGCSLSSLMLSHPRHMFRIKGSALLEYSVPRNPCREVGGGGRTSPLTFSTVGYAARSTPPWAPWPWHIVSP